MAAILVAISPVRAGVTQMLIQESQAVVPASTLPQIATGARWANFGQPSLTDDGSSVGFLGSYINSGSTGPVRTGIFHGPYGNPSVFLKIGDSRTDENGAPSGGVFTLFKDPVFGNSQFWATHAQDGNGVGIWAGIGPVSRRVALKNAVVPDAGIDSRLPSGSKFRVFENILMTPDGTLFFTALVSIDGGYPRHSLWRYRSTIPNSYVAPSLVLIKGEDRTPYGVLTGKVISIKAIGDSYNGSHGRMDASSGDILINYTVRPQGTTTSYEVLSTVSPSGVVATQLASSLAISPFGKPTIGAPFIGADLPADGGSIVASLMLKSGSNGITSQNSSRILDTNTPDYLVARTDYVPDALGVPSSTDILLGVFNGVACGYTGVNTPVSTSFFAYFLRPSSYHFRSAGVFSNFGSSSLTLHSIAVEGNPAPGKVDGAPSIGIYRAGPVRLSHMDGKGPLFTWIYQAANGSIGEGVWGGEPTTGRVVNLIQTGDLIGNREVHRVRCLSYVDGSVGQRRAWVYDSGNPPVRPVAMKVDFFQGPGLVVVTY